MGKRLTTEIAEVGSLRNCLVGSNKENGRIIVSLPDAFATKVSCDVLKYLSMKEFKTYFIDRQDATSFRALHCRSLGFSVAVKAGVDETVMHKVDFFLNDCTRNNPLIRTEEEVWVLLHNGDEIGMIEPHLSVQDEMKVRNMADSAFRALKCAFLKKAKVDLHEFHFQFGRPTSGHWAGKLVIAGAITSKECQVMWSRSRSVEHNDFNLSMLTEKLFLGQQ